MIRRMKLKWKITFGVALFNDILDLIGIGAIPIIGDVIDMGTSVLFWKTLGKNYTLPTLLEFIPGVDVLPIYTVTAAWAYYQEKQKN